MPRPQAKVGAEGCASICEEVSFCIFQAIPQDIESKSQPIHFLLFLQIFVFTCLFLDLKMNPCYSVQRRLDLWLCPVSLMKTLFILKFQMASLSGPTIYG